MKGYLTLIFTGTLSFIGCAQFVNSHVLDFNNVDATVNDGGVFFNNPSTSTHGYSVPSGSTLNTIYSMSFWYGGVDVNGQLKLSAQTYDPLSDQFKGPLTIDGYATPTWNNSLFYVTQDEIATHIANFSTPGYQPVPNIADWPAHGDVSLNFDYYLAPFVDMDGDGTYDPMNGDYPCIRGDHAAYVIMNDKGGVHASGGDPLSIEMHYMFYEYTGIPEIENTTFVAGKVINRGTQTLEEFKVSLFMDGDIGFSGDDYFSSDSTRNLMSFYNGDNMDESGSGSLGYGNMPPASGVVSLSKDFESIGAILDFAPSNAVQYWNLMNGNDIYGNPWTNTASSSPTKFLFASDPSNLTEPDSEVALGTPPGDRRGVASLDFGVLVPSAEHQFDFAVIYNRDGVDNIDNASGLRNIADVVQAFFDSGNTDGCTGAQVGLDEIDEIDFSIYPNPSNGQFTVEIGTDFSNASIEIYDISGREVLKMKELKFNSELIEVFQPSGVYLLHLIVDGQKIIKRIILE